MIVGLITLLLAFGAPDEAVRGRIVSTDGAPVSGATIVLRGGEPSAWHAAVSGIDGAFDILLPPTGPWKLWVAREDFAIEARTIEVIPSSDDELVITLTPAPGVTMNAAATEERALFDEGSDLLTRNRFAEALPKFLAFVERRPWLLKTHYNIGLCHIGIANRLRLGGDRTDAALEERLGQRHFAVVLERYPDFSPALAGLAESLVRSRDMAEATAAYERLVVLVPDDAATWYNYGDVLAWQQNLDGAERAFLKVLEVDRNFIDAHARIGAIAMARGDYDVAIARFETFLARAPASDMAELTKELLRECREKKK